jgi:hypothetical protein
MKRTCCVLLTGAVALIPAFTQAQPSGYRSATLQEYVGAWENSRDQGDHRLSWSYVVISPNGRIGWLNSQVQISDATGSHLSNMLDKGASPGVEMSGWKM